MAAGYIGLGAIGRPMARRLAEAQPGTLVFDMADEAINALAECAIKASSPRDIGRLCDSIAICVRDDGDVEQVLTRPDGVLAGIGGRPGVAIAVHSTISLDNLLRFSAMAHEAGASLVDAAVTGGAEVAARGALTAMVGGAPDVVEQITPMLSAYCHRVIHAGQLGAGMKLKVANNLVTYTQLGVGVEAMRMAALSGVDPQQLVAVMAANGNLTPAMAAYLDGRAKGIAAGGGEPFLSFQKGLAALAEKDLDHALATAATAGAPTLIGDNVRKVFRQIIERIDI